MKATLRSEVVTIPNTKDSTLIASSLLPSRLRNIRHRMGGDKFRMFRHDEYRGSCLFCEEKLKLLQNYRLLQISAIQSCLYTMLMHAEKIKKNCVMIRTDIWKYQSPTPLIHKFGPLIPTCWDIQNNINTPNYSLTFNKRPPLPPNTLWINL